MVAAAMMQTAMMEAAVPVTAQLLAHDCSLLPMIAVFDRCYLLSLDRPLSLQAATQLPLYFHFVPPNAVVFFQSYPKASPQLRIS